MTLNSRSEWLSRPLLIFIATRLLCLASGYFAHFAIPEYIDVYNWHPVPDHVFVDMWARWDSVWYYRIAQEGYTHLYQPGFQSPIAFFPLYPLAMRLLSVIVGNPIVAGELISNLAFLVALILLYRLTELEFKDRDTATRTIFYIALFPTAFFFSAVYTESLFLLCSVAAIYFARRECWFLAALAGMLCSATRVIGVIMWPIVVLFWLDAHGWAWQKIRPAWRSLIVIGLIPVGLLAYMLYLKITFGDPLAFLAAQQGWEHRIIGPFAVISEAIQTTISGAWTWGEPPLLDLIALGYAVVLTVAVWRRLGFIYGLFCLLSILIPISSSTQSFSRFTLVIFPLFMVLGTYKRPQWVVMILFTILLCIFMATFVSWRFVG